MKHSKYILIFFLFTGFANLLVTNANTQNRSRAKQESADKIRIVSVSAAAPVLDGVENEFTVEIQYTLESTDEASVAIGFNVENSGSFKMTGRKKVKRGTNLITLKAKVVPKDWKENGDFSVMANLSPHPLPSGRYSPMAGTVQSIDFPE